MIMDLKNKLMVLSNFFKKQKNNKYKKPANQQGFTLMEILVVLAIFSTAVLILSDIFLITQRVQRKVAIIQRAHSDARFAIEAISREARMGIIDYKYYKDKYEGQIPQGSVDELALVDINENKIKFYKSKPDNENCPEGVDSCLIFSLDTSSGERLASITPKEVELIDLQFFITPKKNPFHLDLESGEYDSNIQPSVTVSIVSEGTSSKVEERGRVHLQTTVATRTYKR